MDTLLQVAGLGLIAVLLGLVLKKGNGVLALLLTLAACAAMTVSIVRLAEPVVSFLSELRQLAGLEPALLQPLLRLDARTLTDVLEQAERALDYDASGTDRTRQDMLRDLVRENTERTIEKQAEALGMLVRADVTLTEEEYPQPWSATLTGTLDPEQVRALSEFLSQSLGIPTERQTWKTYG